MRTCRMTSIQHAKMSAHGISAQQAGLTCNVLSVASALAPCHEHDVALTCVGIVVLQEEELVDSVFL